MKVYKKNKVFCLLFFLSYYCVAQSVKTNFSISGYYGSSHSNATVKNPFWISDKNVFDYGNGNSCGLEINQRLIKGFWFGVGTQFNTRFYAFNRVDPFAPLNNVEKFVRKDFGQDFSIKSEYVQNYKGLQFSALFRIKTHIWYGSKSTIVTSNSILYRNESYFLPSSVRRRLEYGVSASKSFGKSKRWSLRLEGNYSYFQDYKKSMNLDKMDIKSTSLTIGVIRNFKPLNFDFLFKSKNL